MIKAFKAWLYRRKMKSVQEFAHANRNLLVIVADPADDTLFVSYRDKQVTGKINSTDGRNYEVVKNVLRHSDFNSAIDRFIGGLVDIMKMSLNQVQQINDFMKFLDGALFKIMKSLRFTKK